MQNSFKADYEKIIKLLQNCENGIRTIKNVEIENLLTRLRLDLSQHINILKTRIGAIPESEAKTVGSPLTKIMGKVVANKDGSPVSPKAVMITPREIETQELKQKIEDIYGKFAITESDQLYDTFSDIEIRGVAKKAGLPVTDKTPKKIDITFIDQIKNAIIKKQNINAGKTASAADAADLGGIAPDNDGHDSGNTDLNPLLKELTNLSNTAIMEAYDETQIKEFALMANVEVAENTKIDSKFITQLKDSIKSLDAGTNK